MILVPITYEASVVNKILGFSRQGAERAVHCAANWRASERVGMDACAAGGASK